MAMTRSNAIQMVARKLAAQDKYAWQVHPNATQHRKQSQYEQRAEEIIIALEYAMVSYTWGLQEG